MRFKQYIASPIFATQIWRICSNIYLLMQLIYLMEGTENVRLVKHSFN